MTDFKKILKYAPNPISEYGNGKNENAGVKSGEGFYDYSESKKTEKPMKMFFKKIFIEKFILKNV